MLGVVLDRVWAAVASRPRFLIDGGGGGGSSSGKATYVQASHPFGFIGLRLHETILFGRQMHAPLFKGFAVERRAVRDLGATLVDQKSGHQVGLLSWVSDDGMGIGSEHRIEMPSGTSRTLRLFAGLRTRQIATTCLCRTNTASPRGLMGFDSSWQGIGGCSSRLVLGDGPAKQAIRPGH